MKKILLFLFISISSFSQTVTKLPWTIEGFSTAVGQALGVIGTTTGANGIKAVVGTIPITATGSGVGTITGSGTAIVTSITGGYNVSVPGYSAGSGISISGSNQIANTAQDRVVVITGTGIASVAGIYPSFNVYVSPSSGSSYPTQTGINLTISGAGTSTPTFTGFNGNSFVGVNQHKGIVYNSSSWPTLNDFTNGGATASIVGGDKIRLSGTVGGYLDINNTTTIDENIRFVLRYIVGSISGTSNGPFAYIRTLQTAVDVSVKVFCPILTTSGSGYTNILINESPVTSTTGKIMGSPLTAVTGDEIEILLEVEGNYLKSTSRNLSQTNSNISSVNYDYALGGILTGPPNTFNYSIGQRGGVTTITNVNIQSNDQINLDFIFEGDSKMRGIGASYITYNRHQNRLILYYLNKIGFAYIGTEGGTGDRSDNILSRTSNTIAKVKQGRTVVFMPSSNDARNGVAFSTWATNTKNTINTYTAAGLNVFLYNMIPELSTTGIDLSAQAAWISTISGPNITIVDSWGFSKNAGNNFIVASFTGDGIHPNDNWHYAFSTYLIKLKLFEKYTEFYSNGIGNPNQNVSPTNFSIGKFGFPVSSGINNFAIGDFAGISNTTGINGFFLGTNAGASNTTGTPNMFIGYNAGTLNTIGNTNCFIGPGTGTVNSTGNFNTFIGSGVGTSSNTDGNTLWGALTGQNVTGNFNTIGGYRAGLSMGAGASNLYLAVNAGTNNAGGSFNVFAGNNSCTNCLGVDNSVIIGNTSGSSLTSDNNVMIGSSTGSGASNSTVTGAIYIGANSGINENKSYQLHMGHVSGVSVISADATPTINTVYMGPLTFSGINFTTVVGSTTGGTCPANTHYYKIVGVNQIGETLPSIQSAGIVLTGSTSSVSMSWPSVAGIDTYKVYRGLSNNSQTLYYTTTGASFTDVCGTNTISGVPQTMNRAYGVAISPLSMTVAGVLNIGSGLRITGGANTTLFRATLVGGTVTVSNNKVTALSNIFVQRQVDGGTVGASYSITRSAGTSFTITAKDGAGTTNILDTSEVSWWIIEPN